MAKGYQAHKQHQQDISLLGKTLSKRAAFTCEWCGSKDELRTWEYRPEHEPVLETLALLCRRCRDLASGAKAEPNELRSIRTALWSDIPAVCEGAARVLARCKEDWIRDAIEESGIDEQLKSELLK